MVVVVFFSCVFVVIIFLIILFLDFCVIVENGSVFVLRMDVIVNDSLLILNVDVCLFFILEIFEEL